MTQAVILTMVADREQGLKIARSLVGRFGGLCKRHWRGDVCLPLAGKNLRRTGASAGH